MSALLRGMAPAAEDLRGTTIAHYRVEEKLGQGGMGVVYRARDSRLARDVALKVLPASLAADSERRSRLLREARSAAAVNHANIAAVYDVGESDGRVWLAMELVEGTTLRERLAGGALPASEAIRIARQIAAGLARAHEKGIVHRDLKPENVMLARDGAVKILDFGLAKLHEPDSTDSALERQETQTLEGRVMGTPGYMSPEQAAGRPVDARTDVYAFGVVLHEMLTGGLPGVGSGRKPIGDARLEAVVARSLAASPEERWSDAGKLLAPLEAIGSPARRSPWPAALGLAALLGAGALAASTWRHAAPPPSPTPAPSASAAAAPAVTTYVDQPLPETNVPEARTEFAAAMQALRDDSWNLALGHFSRAAQLDPTMAAAHFRLAIGASVFDPETARTELATAASLRTRLSERDRVFLEAMEPAIGRVHKDQALAMARLEAASARWPGDVEFLDWLGGLGTATPERVLAASRRATELDPQDVQAFENLGNVLAVLGRNDEARAVFARGTSIAPQSGDIYLWPTLLDATEGRCDDMDRDARRTFDVDKIQGSWSLIWAGSALRRPEAALRELAAQHAASQPAPLGEVSGASDGMWLSFLVGRFDDARAAAERLAAFLRKTMPTVYLWNLWAATGRVDVALETGDTARALDVARDFTSRSEALTRSMFPHGVAGVDAWPWIARLALGRGPAFDAERSRWIDEQLHAGALPDLVWSFAWAATALSPEEAKEALDARDHDPRLQTHAAGLPLIAAILGNADAYAGHVQLLAGRPAEAIPTLRRAVAACAYEWRVADHVHAQLDLAAALEQTGDTTGACAAFDEVLSRWGHATPRSVSADAARAGVKRLHCPQ
ncbi:MAG TPA: protein kinase [Candidatus Acidoferrales bacterium]|nr:protein kinase [Candidatus Acidoferrales bacterium]